jgi:eukaryotic-like serine/threonine-protein kinase
MDAPGLDRSALSDALRAGRPGFSGALAGLHARVLATAVHGRHTRVGRYRLGAPLGRGAHGTVYEAFDPRLGRPVALKIVAVRTSHDCERVVREARMLATVSDPHVVHVFEVGVSDTEPPAPYVVMELVHGITLRKWLLASRRPWRGVVEMILQAARGLWAAHRVGIVHRDFKPDNAILGEDGRLRVVDFGLARALQELDVTDQAGEVLGSADPALTPAGYVMGTPAYMAPEVFAGDAVPASDQYALSVALYEGLFGHRPFVAASTLELRALVCGTNARLPRDRRGVPRRLCALVMRGLARRPEDRYPDLGAWIAALQRAAAPRRVPMLVPIVGAGVLAAGIVAARPAAGPCDTGEAAWAAARGDMPLANDVDTALLEHRRAWVDTEATACAAAPGPLPWHTRSCLDARLRDVTAIVSLVGRPRRAAALRDASAVQALPSPRMCDEAGSDAVLAPDPADASAVEDLERRLSELRALDATSLGGTHALNLSARLLEDARAVGYAPLVAESGRMYGRMLMLDRQGDAAKAVFEDAYFVAQKADLSRHAAVAATEVFRIEAHERRNPAGAHEWRAHADAAFARAGLDPRDNSAYLDAWGWLAQLEGNDALAIEVLREAVESIRARGGGRSQIAGDLENHLGVVLAQSEQCEAAVGPFRRAASIFRDNDGPRSRRYAAGLDNLGMCLTEVGRLDEALALHEEALEIRESLGPDQPELGASYGNLGLVLQKMGRIDDALAATDRSVALFLAQAHENDPRLAMSYEFRARMHASRGEPGRAAAVRDYASALQAYEALGPTYERSVEALREEIAAFEAPPPGTAP